MKRKALRDQTSSLALDQIPLLWKSSIPASFAAHCGNLSIPWTEEPGGLHPMWSQRLGHELAAKQQKCFPSSTM